MPVQIYKENASIIILEDNSVDTIRADQFDFDPNDSADRISVFDNLQRGRGKQFDVSDIQDEFGAPVGTMAQVITYLSSLMDSSATFSSNQLPATLGKKVSAASLSVTQASDDTFRVLNAGQLVPAEYDEIELTYVVGGPANGEIETATYKLATVTVATLTMVYTGSDLTNITRT